MYVISGEGLSKPLAFGVGENLNILFGDVQFYFLCQFISVLRLP